MLESPYFGKLPYIHIYIYAHTHTHTLPYSFSAGLLPACGPRVRMIGARGGCDNLCLETDVRPKDMQKLQGDNRAPCPGLHKENSGMPLVDVTTVW